MQPSDPLLFPLTCHWNRMLLLQLIVLSQTAKEITKLSPTTDQQPTFYQETQFPFHEKETFREREGERERSEMHRSMNFCKTENTLHGKVRDITLWFFSSVSSVEVSVLGLASAILVSPQFSGWLPGIETGFTCTSFCSGNDWDPTTAAERFISEDARG